MCPMSHIQLEGGSLYLPLFEVSIRTCVYHVYTEGVHNPQATGHYWGAARLEPGSICVQKWGARCIQLHLYEQLAHQSSGTSPHQSAKLERLENTDLEPMLKRLLHVAVEMNLSCSV